MMIAPVFPPFSRFAVRSYITRAHPLPHRYISTTPRLSEPPKPPTQTGEKHLSDKSFEDPTRPGLWYHFVPAPNPISKDTGAFACTLLESPPKTPDSATVLGLLPAVEGAGLRDFKENKKFLDLLHDSLERALKEGADEAITAEATQRNEGWMHINDARNIPAPERVGDADDIIASVRVEKGKVLSETYERMPSYRICTADGLTTLSEGLTKYLQKTLQQKHAEESK
ncbi:hypothetical protein BOTBODRAFT_596818 [Botryobasidium botryosum FD-172 SS1]|uniref:Uncharacterized protein n=1 Tax=Botryobasidium botryosum (strain FD-172 SS1) TaxID=930990 RepID=A0A067LWT8_BOTB1|nr:hypothetical protein BOTBODRAFT_596818 [Botryobasidium botryosum FD-172 SS1]